MSLRRWIRELVQVMREEDLAEIEVRRWFGSVRIRRAGHEVVTAAAPAHAAGPAGGPAAGAPSAPAAEGGAPAEAPKKNLVPITSPMVGTFYRAPAPDADPYIEVNAPVSVGQTVCIIEAMKLMNEIESEVRGRIHEVLVENATPVEYGQVLFLVDTGQAA
ncbi:MAG TPA: acetyl-CoA carboxylase biotin carboxyl carrier protein [Candidatus Eisenbacteria bacterium]|nr:acetyl-CoA carboxylase biotin carboxyl carrier protein [Candidatus Eisenbacteria bacterium]